MIWTFMYPWARCYTIPIALDWNTNDMNIHVSPEPGLEQESGRRALFLLG